ncbi:class I SAM-dependent methyltransferase, partial [Myxococcota bacterium]|nr:class I SAM-dependent methyltransferase [Myxococcota bacterium]
MKGYTFDTINHLWHRQDFAGIAYSDGQEIEERISSIMSEASDRSVLSEELRQQITDWPTEYHFSRLRHCLLRPLGIQAGDRVLELGCGCGAITRYLGETGAEVVAVEGSRPRARIAAQRCKDLENVHVVLENLVLFDTEQRFDWVLLIGVLEYAPLFAESATGNPVQKYLESSSAFLTDKGKLVVAIENQLGLKYFNGCGEDHVAQPFFGIHDLYDKETPITFGKKELQGVLARAGLSNLDFFYPWPDYKLPSVILHSSAFAEPDVRISDLLLRCSSRDYMGSSLRVFSEQFSLPVLERNSLMEDLANSFLVVAEKKDQKKPVERDEFVWIYSCQGRQKCFCTESMFFRSEEQGITVQKSRMDTTAPEVVKLTDGCTVIHRCGSGQFHQGQLLVREILRKRVDVVSNRDLAKAFLPWFQAVRRFSVPVSGKPETQLDSLCLPGKYIDATPFNYIRTDRDDELRLFDTEWEVVGEIPLGWLLYRSVLWGWFGDIPNHSRQGRKSVFGIIEAICALSSLEVNARSMIQWQEMELQFQAVVTLRRTEHIPQFLS